MYRKIIAFVLTVVTFGTMFTQAVFARNDSIVVDFEDVQEDARKDAQPEEINRGEDICGFNLPERKTYRSELIAVRRKLRVEPGETFRVKIFMKNTGSMPWFSNMSKCLGPKMSLGTDKQRDRDSHFYERGLAGWEGSNRVGMDQYRTDPGGIASFTFWGKAGDKPDVYKSYWTPVLKNLEWIDDAQFHFEIMVGDTGERATDLRTKMVYANRSGSVSVINLNAEKSIRIDLSDQRLSLLLGDQVIREFPVSTGASDTPTPVGETRISLKQEVRIAGKKPHYIMPKFMMFRSGGYGFHALPSLGSASLRARIKSLQAAGKDVPTSLYLDDTLWTEALDHIGIPVSHGCIRLLPEDADWMFDFIEIGTKVVVQR